MKILTERSLKDLGVPLDQSIYEPFGRNTAPAVALVCKRIDLLKRANEVVGIFPADHLIDDESKFQSLVKEGEKLAKEGHVVTLGIQPTYPATGYGYIETSGSFGPRVANALKATGFREKPNEPTAREFLERGGFYWNAGMFIFRASTMIELFKKYAPEIWEVIDSLKSDLSNVDEVYRAVRSTSIDYAIMERLSTHVCLPCTFGWSDLGSWDSIADVLGRSAMETHAAEVESTENFVFPHAGKTYGFVGVNDLVVVDTADATLIARRGETELVKQLVDKLKSDGNAKVTEHRFEIRPWGRFEVLADDTNFKAKTIFVDPNSQLSYQSHSRRSEHWIVVSGAGEVTIDSEVILISPGSHVHASVGSKHRIRNVREIPLQLIEIQLGTYFGEDDIVRYDDDYSRT